MSDDGPKSAFELAMERLRQKDTEARIDDRPLTDEQKAAIAALRNARTHEEIARRNEDLRRDKERMANDRDRKIAEIRREEPLEAQRPLPVFRDLVRVTSKPQVASTLPHSLVASRRPGTQRTAVPRAR